MGYIIFAVILPLILAFCNAINTGPDTGYKDNNYGE